MSALYYVLREGLVRGQGRYWLGREGWFSGTPRTTTRRRKSWHSGDRAAAVIMREHFAARGYPMRVVAIVARRK